VIHWRRVVLPSARFRALRNYMVSDVDWHGSTVHFLTTHVDFKAGGDEQLQIVMQIFLNLPEPAILMGDLNHTGNSPQIQQLLSTTGVEEAINSFLGPPPKPRVDWIFLRGLKTIDAGIVDFGASDHPAFWAQVKAQ
jgi:endonuclease/exonuclease/phosphatase family metal-dependent hydrolase